jgi:predicted dinucleotide-binding enzyme
MTTIGFIGSGKIGSTVAKLAVDAGHQVVMSNSRGPDTLADLVAELGPNARAGTAEEAAAAGDLVVVTIPQKAYTDVPAAPLAGKPVLDTINYYPQRDGHVAELDDGSTTSSELLQRHLPESSVVKVFNNINFRPLASLARAAGDPDRSALAIAGDDADAKAAVTRFLDSIGYDAYDVGPLAEGFRFQVGAPAYGTPYQPDGMAGSGVQVPADRLGEALAAATR